MTPPRVAVDYLDDMVEAIAKIERFTAAVTCDAFAADERTVLAVVQALQIPGEAAKQVAADVRERNPGVPWRQMAGMRDRLIHHYFRVEIALVWQTVQTDLPAAKVEIGAALARERALAP
jgi:hypothetical protein